jgi:hypothetical protein
MHANKLIYYCAEAGGGFGASVASPAEGRDIVPGKRHLQEASFDDDRAMSYEEKREVCSLTCSYVCMYEHEFICYDENEMCSQLVCM